MEHVFGLIEPIIARHAPQLDRDSCVDTRWLIWERIITELGPLPLSEKTLGDQ